MNIKTICFKLIAISALFLLTLSVNLLAQTINAEKSLSLKSFVPDKNENAGIVRERIVQNEDVRADLPVKLPANRILELEKLAFTEINKKRAEIGLQPLIWSDELAKIARIHSENMVKYNFFSHRGIDGKSVDGRADSIGLTEWTLIGENIAYNRGYKDPVETAVEKWMLSPSHRANLLNDRWKESAIGIAVTDRGTYFFTQVFLKRK